MKKNGTAAIIGIVALVLLLLTGCTAAAAEVEPQVLREVPEITAPPATEPPATEPPAVQSGTTKLTAEEAKAIALKQAGLTADQVTGLRAEYDVDDGVPEYEVEFRSGDYEYDYTIHAETGAVIKWDKEYDPPKAAATEPPATEPPATEPPAVQSGTSKLTAEEAKAIALKHAGLTAGQVTGLRAEYDVDDGVPEYEVEFRVGRTEYDYEIHAESGKILSWEKDLDD